MSTSSSTSTANRTISKGMSSFVICAPISSKIGGSFTGLTVNSKTSESVRNPSLTFTEICTIPLKFKSGDMVSWSPDMDTVTDSLSLSALKISSELSTSSADKVIVNDTSSFVPSGPMYSNSGESLTGVTITRTSSNAISLPSESLTIKVSVSSPYQFSTDPNVTS